MLRFLCALAVAAFVWSAAPTAAKAQQYQIITDQSQFLGLVGGKILTVKAPFYLRNTIRLVVRRDGDIQGKALGYDLTGSWRWQDGFFCRQMDWEGTEIPYNCQQVQYNGDRVRFVSDRGTGDRADFALD